MVRFPRGRRSAVWRAALERRASNACGLLAADTADIVGAIEYQCRTLALAVAEGSQVDQGRTWNNIGLAFGVAGNCELALPCFHRALAAVRDEPGPVYGRYSACGNLSNDLYNLGEYEEGLRYGRMALEFAVPAFTERDPYAGILLRRNLVRLLIETGHVAEAGEHLPEIAALVERSRTPRALVAAATARAAFELATGRTDIALTRLDEALGRARGVPAALRDTLASVYSSGDRIEPSRTTARRIEFLGRDAVEIYGLYQNMNPPMGGPFKSICFLEGGRLFLIDMSVFNPPGDKLPQLRMLEAIARTFTCEPRAQT